MRVNYWVFAVGPPLPGDPKAGRRHAEPAGELDDARDLGIMVHDVPPSEDRGPIVTSAADQRQYLRARIRHVSRNVQPIFKKPNDRCGEGDSLTFAPK